MTTDTTVKPGQVWADNDKRSKGRYIRVIATNGSHALVEQVAYNERDGIAAALPAERQTHRIPGRTPSPMNEVTRITYTESGYTVVTGWDVTLTSDADRNTALNALFHRGFTPRSAVAAVNTAHTDGAVTVAGLTAD